MKILITTTTTTTIKLVLRLHVSKPLRFLDLIGLSN